MTDSQIMILLMVGLMYYVTKGYAGRIEFLLEREVEWKQIIDSKLSDLAKPPDISHYLILQGTKVAFIAWTTQAQEFLRQHPYIAISDDYTTDRLM